MKTLLGIFLSSFLILQTASAGDATQKEAIDDVTDHQGSAEQFEQTLKDSPTAAGMDEMKKDGEDMVDHANETMEEGKKAGMSHEEPVKEMQDDAEY